MKRIALLALGGALALSALTACSPKGAGTDFCEVSSGLSTNTNFQITALPDSARASAQAGDMTALNAWGRDAMSAIDTATPIVQRAKGGSPSAEATQALDDLVASLGVMRDLASAAAGAADVQAFDAAAVALGDDLEGVNAKMAAASGVLDKAQTGYCS